MGRTSSKALALAIGRSGICAGVAIGGALALFTLEEKVTNHLVVGTGLKAGLYLTSLEKDILDENGLIKKQKVDLPSSYPDAYDSTKEGVDLSKYSGDVIDVDYLAPTMGGEAMLRLYNLGDIAFTFTVTTNKVGYDSNGEENSSIAALKQIDWTAEAKDNVTQVYKGGYADIELSYYFNDQENNNEAMGQKVSLDVTIHATQVTSE